MQKGVWLGFGCGGRVLACLVRALTSDFGGEGPLPCAHPATGSVPTAAGGGFSHSGFLARSSPGVSTQDNIEDDSHAVSVCTHHIISLQQTKYLLIDTRRGAFLMTVSAASVM